MDEIVIRACRGIASYPRLEIMDFLAAHGETTPTSLASKLGIPLNRISSHLRLLASVGLVQGRRSGGKCYYTLTSPYGEETLSGRLNKWLRQVLGQGRKNHRGLPEVRDYPRRRPRDPLHAVIFEAATAFTDLRRLQILRYLETHAEVTVDDLVNKLSMSPDAVSRHTSKLRRRGLVIGREKDGRSLSFRLATEYKTPIHQAMHQIVRSTWQKGSSRTSGSPR
ncbi:MAG: transcriptional regulator [Planctomycetes bacterium]|nr:transcriptional regulator [Verrucomicrobiota bacterium]MBM4047110.1 transcriptional regulator [Planctomycetota bacterium]